MTEVRTPAAPLYVQRIQKTKRPYDPTNNKGRGYKNLYAVYPDYWPQRWGQTPVLGHVRADSEEDAVYAAYDRGLSHPSNCTFGLKIVKMEPANPGQRTEAFNQFIKRK